MIAFDLVAVSPMSSMTGNIAYVNYVKGTEKGESHVGDLTNNIWELGNVDQNYTSDRVVEPVTAAGDFVPAWTPVVGNKVIFKAEDGTETEIEGVDGKFAIPGAGRVKYVYDNVIIPQETLPTLKAELKNIGLEAKARRIAVFYSQLAAVQAKTDYGFDLAD